MSHHYLQISELVLSRYIVRVYGFENNPNNASEAAIANLTGILDSQAYPRGIVENLETLPGISKIEILDSNTNTLLLTSFTPVENP